MATIAATGGGVGGAHQVRTVATPPLVATIATARRDRGLGGCIAAGAGGLVASVAGPKSTCSYRWATARVEEQRRAADEAAEEERLVAVRAKAKEEAATKKKHRVVTKGWVQGEEGQDCEDGVVMSRVSRV